MFPLLGELMAKAKDLAWKVQDQSMGTAWPMLSGCSAVPSLLSPRGIPTHAADCART